MIKLKSNYLTPNGRPSKKLRQLYEKHGFCLFFEITKRSWAIFNLKNGIEFGLMYSQPKDLLHIKRIILIWNRFASIKKKNVSQQVNLNDLPSAWSVMPQEFWKQPLAFKINIPMNEIRKGMDDGLLHKRVVLHAIRKKRDIPLKVLQSYNF